MTGKRANTKVHTETIEEAIKFCQSKGKDFPTGYTHITVDHDVIIRLTKEDDGDWSISFHRRSPNNAD